MHRIVIIGGGAGGLELATRLGDSLGKTKFAHITLVDANLTHIWKPLFHEVAAGSLNSSTEELNYVAQSKWNNFHFQLGRMSGLDRQTKCITLDTHLDSPSTAVPATRAITYDTLVIAARVSLWTRPRLELSQTCVCPTSQSCTALRAVGFNAPSL
jgi:NADH dehydrogenase